MALQRVITNYELCPSRTADLLKIHSRKVEKMRRKSKYSRKKV